MKKYLPLFVVLLHVLEIEGHAALIEPPARNVLWRMGFNEVPEHPQDDYLVCIETDSAGCPPCGDNTTVSSPRPHEAGGKWGMGIIPRRYSSGQVIDVFVNVTRSHGGFIEFKLCPNNNVKSPVIQECLNQYPLQVVGATSSKVKVKAPYDGSEKVKIKVKLPTGLKCSQCVFQMSQFAEQFLPSHVMFRNCADIAIDG